MKIAFHSNQLSLRGTEVAMYDYAKYNEELLGNESIIIAKHPSVWPYSHEKAIKKFEDRFKVFFYKDFKEVEPFLESEGVDVFYAQKAGMKDGVVSPNRKTVIHTVFQHNQPHGDVYAFISNWLGNKFRGPSVPYMVDLPDEDGDLREEIGIPKDAIVFGRHGGMETFDIPMARQSVVEVAKANPNIYFLFMFTNKVADLPNIIHLDGNQDLNYKVKFINTCDAMLHARKVGETFGLAVAEFSLRNKPVITYGGPMRESAHLQMLGDKAIKYTNKLELSNIITNFKPTEGNWNCYEEYNPKNVMMKFKKIFLD